MHGQTIGVEEEFHVVDTETGGRAPAGPQLVGGTDGSVVETELHRSVVETASGIHTDLDGLRRDLLGRRAALVNAAARYGLSVVSAGTLPDSGANRQSVTPGWRYEWMAAEYQQLVHEQQVCACQVQVGVADRDLAVRVTRRIRAWLPVFVALSVSSPYFRMTDTGYSSYRTVVTSRWPTVGPPPDFESAAEYDAAVAALVHSGVICDRGMIYFDARVSARYPTIEIRVADGCPSIDDSILIAALGRAVVRTAIAEDAAGQPVPRHHEVALRAATWRAARSGLDDYLVDPLTSQPVPAGVQVDALLSHVRAELEEYGDWPTVVELIGRLRGRGTSASRQRALIARGASHAELVAALIAETQAGAPC